MTTRKTTPSDDAGKAADKAPAAADKGTTKPAAGDGARTGSKATSRDTDQVEAPAQPIGDAGPLAAPLTAPVDPHDAAEVEDDAEVDKPPKSAEEIDDTRDLRPQPDGDAGTAGDEVTAAGRTGTEPAQGEGAAPTSPPKGKAAKDDDSKAAARSASSASTPGSEHLGLVDQDGKQVDPAGLFTDPVPPSQFVTVKERVFEQFRFPNSQTTAKRLLYPAGTRVTQAQADQVRSTFGK